MHVIRARKLLLGGLVGGVAAAVVSLVLFGVLDGSNGVVSAALAAALVLFFYSGGQLVMVAFADAGARTLLAVAMASYTARVAILGLVLLGYQQHRSAWPTLVPVAVFMTTVVVVAGWLIVEVIVFSRLRIEAFDGGYVAPARREDEQ
ncbi:MAG: hypothetical protein ACR2LI_07425 [Propionibacteriaceae bacterium]